MSYGLYSEERKERTRTHSVIVSEEERLLRTGFYRTLDSEVMGFSTVLLVSGTGDGI